MDKTEIGNIGWIGISVDDATGLRDFYASVVGWQPEGLSMGDARFCVIEDPAGAVAALYQPG